MGHFVGHVPATTAWFCRAGGAILTEKFRRCLAFTMAREGGYVDHPADPGGRTYRGVSERAHPEAWKDGPPSDDAVDTIYYREYWGPAGCEAMSEPLALAVFDYAVHSGVRRALRELGALMNAPRDMKPHDLVVRARTLHAPTLALRLIVERAVFLVRRAFSVPGQDVFAKGWIDRMVKLKRAVEAAQGG
jgi:lysozyme family protein